MERIARRMRDIAPFRVMQILARAREMEAAGRDVVHMEIGEPDFVSPQPVIDAGMAALAAGSTHYTAAAGLPALRAAIAGYYGDRYGIDLDPARVLVTPGASGALQLVLGVLVNPEDEVLLTDPGYPCNRHMVTMLGGVPRSLALSATDGFRIDPQLLRQSLTARTRALMTASPANPTGHVMDRAELADCHAAVLGGNGRALVVDEIYQGLQYAGEDHTALALGEDDLFVINSFSKYFGMTGWRVGWVVAPRAYVDAMDRLAQNIFLAAPTVGQHAALAAFLPETREILEARRDRFAQRRDYLLDALQGLGLSVAAVPQGAFYIYVDIGDRHGDSVGFCAELLEQHAVACTPGVDFGHHRADRYVRFAYTTGMERLETGVERLRVFLSAGG